MPRAHPAAGGDPGLSGRGDRGSRGAQLGRARNASRPRPTLERRPHDRASLPPASGPVPAAHLDPGAQKRSVLPAQAWSTAG